MGPSFGRMPQPWEEQIKVVHGSKLGSMLRVKGIELKCTFDTALAWATLQGGPRSAPRLETQRPVPCELA